jgi:hypothetical protein
MADLLECLLQIKGLRESADRMSALVAGADAARWHERPGPQAPTAAELLTRLAELEVVHGTALRLCLTAGASIMPFVDEQAFLQMARFHQWSSGEALACFLARRAENLDILDRCTADDLARQGTHPVRRHPTVADLVAVMLASDFEHLGDMRRALGGQGR